MVCWNEHLSRTYNISLMWQKTLEKLSNLKEIIYLRKHFIISSGRAKCPPIKLIKINRIYAPGTMITRRDIQTELPFGNVVVKLGLKGSQIWEALENGVSQVEQNAGRFPQVSGMSFKWNPKAEVGSRIVSVEIGGLPLIKGKNYTVATNDYLANGGDGYSVFKKGKVIIDASGATYLANMVMNHIEAKGTVSPKVEGRIVAQ